VEPSINAISTLIVIGTSILLYVAEKLTREDARGSA
jgi:ABC-type spermidine/putrescine transport system permease subunit II